jgi:hypothetical protein
MHRASPCCVSPDFGSDAIAAQGPPHHVGGPWASRARITSAGLHVPYFLSRALSVALFRIKGHDIMTRTEKTRRDADRAARIFGASTNASAIEKAEALLRGLKLSGASKRQIAEAERMIAAAKAAQSRR